MGVGSNQEQSGEASWRSVGKRWKESLGPKGTRFCPLGQRAVHHGQLYTHGQQCYLLQPRVEMIQEAGTLLWKLL